MKTYRQDYMASVIMILSFESWFLKIIKELYKMIDNLKFK